jgi:hypothetical protein
VHIHQWWVRVNSDPGRRIMAKPLKRSRWKPVALAFALLGGLSITAVALADTITGDANSVTTNVDSTRTVAPGGSGSGKFALIVNDNATDPVNGCNAGGSGGNVVLNVSSNQSWLTVTPSQITITGCDNGSLTDGLTPAGTVNYSVSASAPADATGRITASYASGGKPGGSYAPGFFDIQTPAVVNTAPTVPGKPGLAVGSATPNQGAFGLAWTASTDAESDPITYRLEHRDANDAAFSLVTGAGSLSSNAFAFASGGEEGQGTWTYQVRASDGSLTTVFSAASDPVKVDRSGPSAPSASPDRSPEDATGNWFKDTVTISYSGSTDPDLPDGSAGSGAITYSAPENFTSSGSHNYSGKATDAAGNDSDPTTGTVKVDATDPSVSISGCPTALLARDSSHAVTVSASDAHSGLDQDPSGSPALDTSSAGPHTYTATATDQVGHSKSADCDYTVNSAPTAPGAPSSDSDLNQGQFTLSWDPGSDPNGAASGGALDHYLLEHKDADDAGYSEVAEVAASETSFSFGAAGPEDEGTWRYRVTSVDELGEQSPASAASDPVKVDRSGPSAPSASPDRSPEDATGNWFKDTVTISYSGSTDPDLPDGSAGSGAITYSAPENFTSSGSHNYSGKATDAAGNDSDPTTGTVKVDATDPSVAISGCPTGSVPFRSSQSVIVGASDDHSGLATNPGGIYTLDANTAGQHTRSFTATDRVGNSKSASCVYTVATWDFPGFFRPVDPLPTYNLVKAGSSVPIKFSLDGAPVPGSNTGQGLSIFASAPASAPITCNSTADVDAVEETGTAGNSSLTYDATADQYVYVWKTEKAWANSCRQFALKLADGTTQRANFKFAK